MSDKLNIDVKDISSVTYRKVKVSTYYLSYIDFYYKSDKFTACMSKDKGKWEINNILHGINGECGLCEMEGLNLSSIVNKYVCNLLRDCKDEFLYYFVEKSSIRIELMFE